MNAKLLLLFGLLATLVLVLQGLVDAELLYGMHDGGTITRVVWGLG